ncbi:hypothetical protein AAKU67_003160 [Oxalobacteraceae bacterium GrIS 2.11]
MSISALQSNGWSNTPVAGYGPANARRNAVPPNSAASHASVESTQVTLSANANLTFSNLPASLALNPNPQNLVWKLPPQQSGSSNSGATLLGQFAENELASQLKSASELDGATVTMDSFNATSTDTFGSAQETSSGQGSSQSASVAEGSSSVTLQGSGKITLADGEVIPFTAELDTSISVVESKATQTSGQSTTAAPDSSSVDLSSLNQALKSPTSGSAPQPASNSPASGLANEWNNMLKQYDELLNLFETVKSAVGKSSAQQPSAVAASNSAAAAAPQANPAVAAMNASAIAT